MCGPRTRSGATSAHSSRRLPRRRPDRRPRIDPPPARGRRDAAAAQVAPACPRRTGSPGGTWPVLLGPQAAEARLRALDREADEEGGQALTHTIALTLSHPDLGPAHVVAGSVPATCRCASPSRTPPRRKRSSRSETTSRPACTGPASRTWAWSSRLSACGQRPDRSSGRPSAGRIDPLRAGLTPCRRTAFASPLSATRRRTIGRRTLSLAAKDTSPKEILARRASMASRCTRTRSS